MKITRRDQSTPYDAPGHFSMRTVRLQGLDTSPLTDFWIGHSTLSKGGHATEGSGPVDKVYVVLSGRVVVVQDGIEHVLNPLDSIYIPAGESRSLHNGDKTESTMLVIIGTQKKMNGEQ